jgi:3'-5' exoribonuclease
LSEHLTAEEILKKTKESRADFSFKAKLQVIKHIKKYTKNEKPYLSISFRDISGEIPNFTKWTNNEEEYQQEASRFEQGNIIEIAGTYKNKFGTVDINAYRKLDKSEFNLENFIKPSKIDSITLFDKIEEVVNKIQTPKLKELTLQIFSDEDIKKKYIECPSSIIHHHNYKHGNLEHTVGMITIFEQLISYYEGNTLLDIDLIYTGIILHDIGKIFEFRLNNGLPIINEEGNLFSHLILGDRFISEIIKSIDDFPKDLENKIRHLILSHHGKKEWNSVVEPQIDEAVFLHYLDMIDSRFKLNY